MWPPNVVKCLVLKRFASLPTSPRHGRQFFFLGQLEVIRRDLQMMVTNFLDHGAISKAFIFSAARARYFLARRVACRTSSPFFAGEHTNAPAAPAVHPLKLSSLSSDP
jgi:hypothetical protein